MKGERNRNLVGSALRSIQRKGLKKFTVLDVQECMLEGHHLRPPSRGQILYHLGRLLRTGRLRIVSEGKGQNPIVWGFTEFNDMNDHP